MEPEGWGEMALLRRGAQLSPKAGEIQSLPSFRSDAKHRARNLEIPGPREDACPGMTAIEASVRRSGFVVVQRDAIQLQPVIDQLVAELAGDFSLQLLDLLGGEFDHLAVAQIDQMVVVAVAHLFIAGAALAKVMPLDDAGVLEQLDGSVHRRDRDLVVDRDAAAIQFLDVGMI